MEEGAGTRKEGPWPIRLEIRAVPDIYRCQPRERRGRGTFHGDAKEEAKRYEASDSFGKGKGCSTRRGKGRSTSCLKEQSGREGPPPYSDDQPEGPDLWKKRSSFPPFSRENPVLSYVAQGKWPPVTATYWRIGNREQHTTEEGEVKSLVKIGRPGALSGPGQRRKDRTHPHLKRENVTPFLQPRERGGGGKDLSYGGGGEQQSI